MKLSRREFLKDAGLTASAIGIRIPMIARWPGKIKPNSQCNHISAFWDILPTFAELACGQKPKGIDGISFVPALLDKPQVEHEYLYWEFHEGSSKQAVRMGTWKAVHLAPSRAIELYNLNLDIGEEDNIADRHPDIVARAKEIMDKIRTDADVWPLKDKAGTMPF